MARSRGAASGFLLLLLGAWGALIPFIGPYFNFSYTPDKAWTWTQARGWLEVLPGAVTFVGGLLLLLGTSRMMTLLAAWLAVAGGAWFVVGPELATTWNIGSPGTPAGSSDALRVVEQLAMFSALGVVIVFLGAAAFGRLSVVSPRDVRAAERRQLAAEEQARVQEARDAEIREQALRDAHAREDAQSSTQPTTQPEDGASSRHAAGNDPQARTTQYTPTREYASHTTDPTEP